jgi:hypothetical protein
MPTRTITMLRGRTSEGQSIVFCSSTLADRPRGKDELQLARSERKVHARVFRKNQEIDTMDTSAIDLSAIAIAWGTR